MIAITVKWPVKPEYADQWPEISRDFTASTRAEDGCLWFEWSRSLEDSNEYVLVEAFRDSDAGAAHTSSAHFVTAMETLGQYVSDRPLIISVETPGEGWNTLGELQMSD